jgi:tetratricopeptide (TPR) repeat protein
MYIRSLIILAVFVVFSSCEDDSPTHVDPVAENATPLDSLNQVILGDPENLTHYISRAKVHSQNGEYEMALQDLKRAIRIDSTDADIYHTRGEIHYFNRDVEAALADFENCIALDDQHESCLLKKAEIDLLLRNYSLALENINNALRINGLNPMAYYMKGILYKETGDTSLAVSSYITATELDPDFYDAFVQIGLLYAAAKDDLALEYYNSALEISPSSSEALYNKGMFLQETSEKDVSRLQDALAVYRQIESIDSTMAPASYNQGFIYLEYYAHYDSAEVQFTRAIDKYPMYYQAYYNRGLCRESLELPDSALKDYDRALALQPDYTPAAIAKGRVLGE